MLVYGDRSLKCSPSSELAALSARFEALEAMPHGIARHSALVGAFIRLGGIVQGVADAAFQKSGLDGASPDADALMAALVAVARSLIVSWESGFADLGQLPSLPSADGLPAEIEIRLPEGYAFYALYPESYLGTAARLSLSGKPYVIGIRSIGTGLAALVAARLGAPDPLTVRPVGAPFSREIRLHPDVAATIGGDDVHYVVVDEGPGLSGSSFAAVGALLETHGVPAANITFLPSHGGGPGPAADDQVHRIWAEASVVPADTDALLTPRRIMDWVEPLLGRVDRVPTDISAGGWRRYRFPDEARWPAVNPQLERRKYFVSAQGRMWLVKFAGLGDVGERKLANGRILAAAGLVPEIRGLVHGLLVESWIAGDSARPDIGHVARYMAARAKLLEAPPGGGASISELFEMAAYNIETELGSDAARQLRERYVPAADLEGKSAPMSVDGRMDAHEWLAGPNGAILKADALDHDAAHDLIGAQDLAWDVAGALAELDLSRDEQEQLVARLRATNCFIDDDLLRFLEPCYLAFRMGLARHSCTVLCGWPEEARRNDRAALRYAELLSVLLAGRRSRG